MRLLILSLFLLPFLAANVSTAHARCLCSPKSFKVRWHKAAAVFRGTVTDIAFVTKNEGIDDPGAIVTLDVKKLFKGKKVNPDDPFKLHTTLTRYTCMGHPFKMGETYLVFAYKRELYEYESTSYHRYSVDTYGVQGLCGGTALFQDAGEDISKIQAAIASK